MCSVRKGLEREKATRSAIARRGREREEERKRAKEGARGIAVNLCVCDHRVLRATVSFLTQHCPLFNERFIETRVISKTCPLWIILLVLLLAFQRTSRGNRLTFDFDVFRFEFFRKIVLLVEKFHEKLSRNFRGKIVVFSFAATPSDRLFDTSGRNHPYRSVALAGWPSRRPGRPRYITDG